MEGKFGHLAETLYFFTSAVALITEASLAGEVRQVSQESLLTVYVSKLTSAFSVRHILSCVQKHKHQLMMLQIGHVETLVNMQLQWAPVKCLAHHCQIFAHINAPIFQYMSLSAGPKRDRGKDTFLSERVEPRAPQ